MPTVLCPIQSSGSHFRHYKIVLRFPDLLEWNQVAKSDSQRLADIITTDPVFKSHHGLISEELFISYRKILFERNGEFLLFMKLVS